MLFITGHNQNFIYICWEEQIDMVDLLINTPRRLHQSTTYDNTAWIENNQTDALVPKLV